ncbi:MAG: VWA domain-containing protein [Ignavibacteriae bacterium]|nr:VWA domain-containing protein [Ignavibacteriota bacterium]
MWHPNTTFANPEFLWGLIIIPLLVSWYIRRHRRAFSDVRFSTLDAFAGVKPTWRERLRHGPMVLRMVIIAAVIVGMARPQTTSQGEDIYTEGIDIAMLLDISGSMLAEDFQPNRIKAAKAVAQEFVDGRRNDRIGLVIFAGQSFTQCPMTTDYRVLKDLLRQVEPGMVEDGTAIGMAIAQGVNRLKDGKAKSKVMILLTDGVNNRGEIDPITAAQIAQTFDIRIYTVGVGTIGEAPYPVQTPFGTRYQNVPVDVDEKTLSAIAEMTGAKYFRAKNNRALKQIYEEIDQLEKTRIEVKSYRSYTERFTPWAWLALAALLLELLVSGVILRKVP